MAKLEKEIKVSQVLDNTPFWPDFDNLNKFLRMLRDHSFIAYPELSEKLLTP